MNKDFNIKNVFCSYCGTKFTEQKLWPRKCFICYNDSFSNPIPVIVILQPFIGYTDQYGLLIQQRGIEPKKEEWALTSGYIDDKETWQQAAVRESLEETGIISLEYNYKLFDVTSSTNQDNILIFCYNRIPIRSFDFVNFRSNREVLALDVMWVERDLAFPSHTENANKFLNLLSKGQLL